MKHAHITKAITDYKYKVNERTAAKIAAAVMKYEDPVFPKAHHILGFIAHESNFKPAATNSNSSAYGLMQVIPVHHNIVRQDMFDIDSEIKHGVRVLKDNYAKVKNEEGTYRSYYSGYGAYKDKKRNKDKENAYFKEISPHIDHFKDVMQKWDQKFDPKR
jgi:soluble lytic murein transglycosylase-like protein